MRNSVRCLRIAGTGIVISQLQARGYFPTLLAPTVAPLPGTVVTLTQSPVVGVLYRTLDGTDPRPFGGSPSAAAA